MRQHSGRKTTDPLIGLVNTDHVLDLILAMIVKGLRTAHRLTQSSGVCLLVLIQLASSGRTNMLRDCLRCSLM